MSDDVQKMIWEQTLELAQMSLKDSRNELSEVVDRFTWDTGSDKDRARIKSLEESILIKKCIANYCIENK